MTRSRRISHTPSTHRPSCRSCIFIRSTELCSVCRKTTAWNTRDARWSMVIAGISADPKQADALKTWGRAYWKAIHPFNLEGGYVNFLMDDEVQGASPGHVRRQLQASSVKAKYDPENLFRVNQDIPPAAA